MFNFLTRKPTSVLVTGSGRSGTSLMMGCISGNYENLGDKPIFRNDESNPKGFFEDADVNFVNDRIIEENGISLPIKSKKKGEHNKGGWINTKYLKDPLISLENIKIVNGLIEETPFCFKDPRFTYTYPIWKELIKEDFVLVAVFRHPSKTATSMLKEPTPKDIGMNYEQALDVWYKFYEVLLSYNDVIFLHYDQIMNKELEFVEKILRINIDYSFIDPTLNRSPEDKVSNKYKIMYEELISKSSP